MVKRRSIAVPHGFTPRDYQKALYNCIRNGKKRAIVIWHRRAGKDKVLLCQLASHAISKPGIYFYILPTYKQARKVIWEGMDSFGNKNLSVFPDEIIKHKNNQEMVLTLVNDSVIYFLGSDNIDSIVGTNPIGICFSEYSLHKPHVWDFLRPILVENGGWAVFNGTPRGKNHMYKMLLAAQKRPEEWYSEVLTIDDTGVMTHDQVEDEIENGMDRATAMQEFYCSFDAALTGAYYDEAMSVMEQEGRIQQLTVSRTIPVHVAWDLGVNDTMVLILYQKINNGNEYHIIDCIHNNGKGLQWYVKELQNKPYIYGYNYLPHDVKVREMGSVSYNGEAKTRLKTLQDLGLKNIIVVPKLPVLEGINASRGLLYKAYICKTRCEQLIEALKTYRKEWDEVNQVFLNKPVHDWSSHYADALRQMAIGDQQDPDMSALPEVAIGTGYDPVQAYPNSSSSAAEQPAYIHPFKHRETTYNGPTWDPGDYEVADGFYS